LKREIKKLQKLREQIKVWQTQNEVKDKEKLLEYRRLVEVAMEKYKVVEKGSKIKAYSNMSLKQGADLDPEEKEKLDTINFIQDSIDDIERQFQSVEVEIEKISGKKSKKNAGANEAKKDELKELQTKYRWHQQQLEIALRLLENDELQVNDILEIKEDLVYFLENNRDPNFIDNEYIYEALDLESNELLSQEVVSSFTGMSQQEKDEEKREKSASPSIQSPAPQSASSSTSTTTAHPAITGLPSPANTRKAETPKAKKFVSLSTNSSSTSTTNTGGLPSTNNNNNNTTSVTSSSSMTSTLKPAVTPVKPANEMKWSALAAGINNNNNEVNSPVGSSSVSTATTPATSVAAAAAIAAESISKDIPVTPTKVTIPNNNSSATTTAAAVSTNIGDNKSTSIVTESSSNGVINNNNNNNHITQVSSVSNTPPVNELEYQQDSELINLPPGIQDIISSFVSCRKSTNNNESKTIGNVSRLLEVPKDHLITKSIPLASSSLDLIRVSNNWNSARYQMTYSNYESLLHNLDNSTLFFAFYYSFTPYENHIVEQELNKRNWRSDLLKKNWYQKINSTIPASNVKTNEFEISNFKKFDSEHWALVDLINYKLEFKNLSPVVV